MEFLELGEEEGDRRGGGGGEEEREGRGKEGGAMD